MSTTQLKTDIDQFLRRVNDPILLRAIRAMLSDYVADQDAPNVVGYDVEGQPIDGETARKEYSARLQRMHEGQEVSLEDLKKNAKKW